MSTDFEDGSARRLSKRDFFLLALSLLLSCFGFYLKSVNASRHYLVPDYDGVDYLNLARDFKDRGSLLQVVTGYFHGNIREDNRHPLYMMMLSSSMQDTGEDFATAKMLNLAIGIGFIGTFFLLASLLWGSEVGCLAAFFLSISTSMIDISLHVCCDVLFACLYFLSLAILLRWSRWKWAWCAYGASCGMAYLAKGNGHLLLVPGVVLAVWRGPRNFFKKPHVYLAIVGFVLVSSFLLVRNARVYHNPLHHFNNKMFWMDDMAQSDMIAFSREWDKVGLYWYFNHHSFTQAVVRILYGAVYMGRQLLLAMEVSPARNSFGGVAMFSLTMLGLAVNWRNHRRERVVVLGSVGVVLFVLFSWFAPFAGECVRYVFPVAVSLLPFAAVGAISLYHAVRRKIPKLPPSRIAITTGVCLGALLGITLQRDALGVNPRDLWRRPPEWQGASDWIREHVNPMESLRCCQGGDFSCWDWSRKAPWRFGIDVRDEVVREYMLRSQVEYILVDRIATERDSFGEKYGPRDQYGPTTFIGWPRCFHDDRKPSDFLIFRRNAAPEYAIAHWRGFIENDPGNAEGHYHLGRVLTRCGKLDDAIAEYKAAVTIDPGYAEAHAGLAQVLCDRDRQGEAIVHFRKALDIKPGHAEGLMGLVLALVRGGHADEAIAECRMALEKNPDSCWVHNGLGIALDLAGKTDEAIEHYQKAVEINPGFAGAYNNLGMALARQGRFDAAIASYDKALAIMPLSESAHSNLGDALAARRQFEKAILHWRKVLELNPSSAHAREQLRLHGGAATLRKPSSEPSSARP